MGWKNIKEQFGIQHHVQVTEKGVCIGSGYVYDLVSIDRVTGKVYESNTFTGFLKEKYPALLVAAPEELVRLIAEPDTFSGSIPVYTYEGAEIIEKMCEVPGWPNVTHDGSMMYDNTFSTDKAVVVEWAKRNAACATEGTRRRIDDVEQELTRLKIQLAGFAEEEAKLAAAYPEAPVTG
jgi:hypothetical protein